MTLYGPIWLSYTKYGYIWMMSLGMENGEGGGGGNNITNHPISNELEEHKIIPIVVIAFLYIYQKNMFYDIHNKSNLHIGVHWGEVLFTESWKRIYAS